MALAFFDWFFQRGTSCSNQNQLFDNHGVYEEQTELAAKYPEFVMAREDGQFGYEHIVDTDKYVDANDMITKAIGIWGNVAIGYSPIDDENGNSRQGGVAANELADKYTGTGVLSWVELDRETRAKQMQALPPKAFYNQYRVAANEEFPAVMYLDAETQELLDDLYMNLYEYSLTETAKFITGERPIEELEDYFDEMDALGGIEFVQIFQDYYDAVVGS